MAHKKCDVVFNTVSHELSDASFWRLKTPPVGSFDVELSLLGVSMLPYPDAATVGSNAERN